MGPQAPAVEIEGLKVVRGDTEVLPDLSLTVARGAVVGLLGPSGSGKSTLMRAIVGVQVIQGGVVRVLGSAAGEPEVRSRVAYMTQSTSVYDDLSVRENLRYFAAVLGTPPSRVDEVIATVGLADRANQVVGRLSGGQRGRVSLAAALVGDPELLVLDEPTVGLDPVLRRDLWSVFRGLAASGATLLVSSHVMDEADECETILLLREGRLIAAETPDELRRRTGVERLEDAFLRLVEAEEKQP
jgi:ABC-2 type transport system ATP-binding protein